MSTVSSILSAGRTNLARDGKPDAEVLLKRDRFDGPSLKRIIRDMGLKVTEQRVAILESLARGRVHVTAQEVYEKIRKTHPEIGFATVYRFLRDLSDKKFVTEVRMGGLPARYELTPRSHHDHLTCMSCGKIVEFENPDIEALQDLVARNNGFQLTGHVLELYGLCQTCQKKSPTKG
jgi:Fur family transcriptional regulator, ferric uptake regulator